jgi:hypothetical protein
MWLASRGLATPVLDCRLKYEKTVAVKEAAGVVAHEYTHTGQWCGVLNVKKNTYSIHVSADMTYREITSTGPGFST